MGNITEYFDQVGEVLKNDLLILRTFIGFRSHFVERKTQIVRPVYDKLLDTFLGKPDKAWWNDIVLRQAKVIMAMMMTMMLIMVMVMMMEVMVRKTMGNLIRPGGTIHSPGKPK